MSLVAPVGPSPLLEAVSAALRPPARPHRGADRSLTPTVVGWILLGLALPSGMLGLLLDPGPVRAVVLVAAFVGAVKVVGILAAALRTPQRRTAEIDGAASPAMLLVRVPVG